MYAQKTSRWMAIAAITALFCNLAAAQTAAKPAAKPVANANAGDKQGSDDKKLDISDLEKKYWAPKDTDFSVVQNRTYTKANRFFLTPQIGRPVNDPYSEGNIYGLTANYFMSERFGIQATYLRANLKDNRSTNDLASLGSGVQPDHGRMTGYYGVGFNFVPFYAKMSFMGKKIIYFDMAITPTIGMNSYEQVMASGNANKSAFSYGVDISQYFFFTNYFAIRADLKNQWHTQEVVKYRNTGSLTEGTKVRNQNTHDTLFLLGFTFFY